MPFTRRPVRILHTAIAVLFAGGLIYVTPGTATTQSSLPANSPAPSGTSGDGHGAYGFGDAIGADAAAAAAAVGATIPAHHDSVATPAPTTFAFDIYDSRAERWQEPDKTACTADSTLSMLNTIFYAGAPAGFVWTPTTSFAEQETILAYERAHMTMALTSSGSDPHGWRNALNYFGWGNMKAGVYADESFPTFAAAAKAAVSALATTRKPVGILAIRGRHAQFITGYKVTGADPATGATNFTIVGIYLTDPKKATGHRDTYVSYATWGSGGKRLRFFQYLQTDSPNKDRLDRHVGTIEWFGKWVIVAPVK